MSGKGDHKKAAATFALGVDIGGTFTDLALLERQSGSVVAGKVLTDYEDFARGVLSGIDDVLRRNEIRPEAVELVVHGTTLATNALIQRRGGQTALIVTKGFRDILEMARGNRYDIFDLEIELPSPLVPRSRVFEADERLDHKGQVIAAIAEDDIRKLARELVALGIQGVGVCLLHAYANPLHEKRIGAILAAEAPDLAVSLSSEVVSEIGEYERATTTAANVFLQPIVKSYLERLRSSLAQLGLRHPLLIITSDGGTVSCETATAYPVRLIESGPAGGAAAAAYFSRRLNIDKVMAFDMGGTTAKICLVDDGEPMRTDEFEAARVYRFARGSGLPLKVPSIELIEIGAGGGSIARVDETGLLKVGPDSASAAPGPACYGIGGTLPTVTDADLCLGYLDADFFLGGEMKLDRQKALEAIETHIAKPLGISTTRAAWGIHEVVNSNMARSAKIHCLEKGVDPRSFTMIAFGGAGPVHAYRVASMLGINRVMFPVRAGIMSALGFLAAPPSFELVRAFRGILEESNVPAIEQVFAEMRVEGLRLLESAGVAPNEVDIRREIGIRYLNQTFALNVRVPDPADGLGMVAAIQERFTNEFRTRYHRENRGVALEILSLRSIATGSRPEVHFRSEPGRGQGTPSPKGARQVFFPGDAGYLKCPVYDRQTVTQSITGPAVIEERESTVLIGPDARADVDQDGNLLVTLAQQALVDSRMDDMQASSP